MDDKYRLLIIAALVGFIGDALTQLAMNKKIVHLAGLEEYFQRHGKVESMFIASAILSLFYAIYLMLNLPLKWYYLAIYGIVLDIIFRRFRVFPSLDKFYSSYNYLQTGLMATAIPFVLPIIINNAINIIIPASKV